MEGMRYLGYALLLLGCYLAGCINLSYLIARKAAGVDLRRVGSGNLGASNLSTQMGKGVAAVAFFTDCGLEAAAILVMRAVNAGPIWQAAAGLAVIVGHNWPFYLRFQGGRGMAMALTGTLILMPYEGLLLTAFLALGVFTRHTAEMNLLGLLLVPFAAWLLGRPGGVLFFAVAVVVLTVLRRLQGSPGLEMRRLRDDPRRVLVSRLIYDREVP